MMSGLDRKVLICRYCGSSQVTVKYGEDKRYPDDYIITCLNCDNWEEGNGRPHSFEVLDEPILGEGNEFATLPVIDRNWDNRGDIGGIAETLVDDIISRCSEIAIEEIFTEQGINSLVKDFRKALLSEYNQINKELLSIQKDRVVHELTGADIITVLHDMGEGEIVRDPEELKKVMDYLECKLEIPWVEYVEAALDIYSWRKNN